MEMRPTILTAVFSLPAHACISLDPPFTLQNILPFLTSSALSFASSKSEVFQYADVCTLRLPSKPDRPRQGWATAESWGQ